MADSSKNNDFSIDCAKNYLNSLRILFPNWTIQQISDYWIAQEDWNSLSSLAEAFAILKGRPTRKLDLSAAMPSSPNQTRRQQLSTGVSLRPLETIVSANYNTTGHGINWQHYKNIWKFYTIGVLYKQEYTPQQQMDLEELRQAIESVENKSAPRTYITAEAATKRHGRYLQFGRQVIDAMAIEDAFDSLVALQSLQSEIRQERGHNAEQLQRAMDKSQRIVTFIQHRYTAVR